MVSESAFDEMFGTNVKGTVFLCQAALPYLRQVKGSIVTVSSDAGLQGKCSLLSIWCVKRCYRKLYKIPIP